MHIVKPLKYAADLHIFNLKIKFHRASLKHEILKSNLSIKFEIYFLNPRKYRECKCTDYND